MSKVSNWAIIEKLAVLEHHCRAKVSQNRKYSLVFI